MKTGVFPKHSDRYLRLIAWREFDKPRIVLQTFVRLLISCRRNLGRASLAANIHTLQFGPDARAAFVHNAIHSIHDAMDVFLVQRPLVRLLVFACRNRQMRRVPDAANREAADGARKLQGGYRERTLSNGNGNRLAREPFLAESAQFPFRGGHGAGCLIGQIDAGPRPESRLMSVESDVIDPRFITDVVKIDITGLLNAPVQRNRAVDRPASVRVAVKGSGAGAMKRGVFVDTGGFESGKRHDGLECGTGRKLGLDGAVEQRISGIARQFPPVFSLDANRELVGIVTRMRGHGEYFAGVRIEGDQRAASVSQCQLGNHLQVEIDRQAQALARNSFLYA